MVSGINNIEQTSFQPQLSKRRTPTIDTKAGSPTSFADEDEAIISSQAKMQNELEKFNSGGDYAVVLAVSCVVAKTTVSAEVNVINAKIKMLDAVLEIGK